MQIKHLALTLLLAISAINLNAADIQPQHTFTGTGANRRCTKHTANVWALRASGAAIIATSCYASSTATKMLRDPQRIPGASPTNFCRATLETSSLAGFIYGTRLIYLAQNYQRYLRARHQEHGCTAHDPLRR